MKKRLDDSMPGIFEDTASFLITGKLPVFEVNKQGNPAGVLVTGWLALYQYIHDNFKEGHYNVFEISKI
jgi:hypothetical protein